MDLSWPKIAASQFTAYMALMNFSTTLGFLFAGRAFTWWTFQGIYLVAAAVQIGAALLLLAIDPMETRNKLPLPEGQRARTTGLWALLALLAFLVVMTGYVTLQKLG